MKLVLAEKPSVAMSLSKVIGADQRGDGYMEGNGYPAKLDYTCRCKSGHGNRQ